ncbi:8893_t:CDS:2, partial [Funneliformis mosseae]
LAGIWAWVVFRSYKWSFLIPFGFIVVALLTGFVEGTAFGLVLAVIYLYGDFGMTLWIPFLWGLIQALILLMGCYSTITSFL